MNRVDTKEAVPICVRTLEFMLATMVTRGLTGAAFRTAVGDFIANAESLIANDAAGPPLDDIFEKARLAGMTQPQLDRTRAKTAAEVTMTVGATLIRDSLIHLALATEARIIADMTFISRSDVEALQSQINDMFASMEEVAADNMDQMLYQGLVSLHAAVTFHLVQTGRPLPRMLDFQFNQSLPTLVAAYRLYADASRADQLRNENKVVHPAFMPMVGRALSN